MQRHTSQNIDYKDNNTGCSDYCENIVVVGHNFRGFYKVHWSTGSWIRSIKYYRQQSMRKLYFVGFYFFVVYLFIFFYYIYITPVNNLPLGARKPQRFTNIYNEQYFNIQITKFIKSRFSVISPSYTPIIKFSSTSTIFFSKCY